jgi:hypothetical protein
MGSADAWRGSYKLNICATTISHVFQCPCLCQGLGLTWRTRRGRRGAEDVADILEELL